MKLVLMIKTPLLNPYYPTRNHRMFCSETITNKYHQTDVFVQGEGGSIPILAGFQEVFNTPVVLIGLNAPNDNIHAPNERFKLDHTRTVFIHLFITCPLYRICEIISLFKGYH